MNKPLTDAELNAIATEHPAWSHENLHSECGMFPCLVARATKELRELREQNTDLQRGHNEAVSRLLSVEGQNTNLVTAADKVVKDEPAYYTNGERACGHCKQQSVARWRIDHAADCSWVNLRDALASVKGEQSIY